MATLLDPTSELKPRNMTPLPRLKDVSGKTVGLLDISKPRGDIFINRLENLLNHYGVKTMRYRKPTFTRIAPVELKQRIVMECDAIVESLAD